MGIERTCECLGLACCSCINFLGVAGDGKVFCGGCHGVEEGPHAFIERDQVPVGQECDDYTASIQVMSHLQAA